MERKINVFTHHKCGSTWLCWVLRTVFEQNKIDYYWSHFGDSAPASDRQVSILQNAHYSAVRDHLGTANIHFIRNPLSVLASAYFSHRATHPSQEWLRLEDQRRALRRCDKTKGMLLTLAFLNSYRFSPRTPGPFASMQAWDYDDHRITTVRMEDAVLDPAAFLSRFAELCGFNGLTLPDPDQFRFERFTGRPVGRVDETSHYRSGDPDGWRYELPSLVVDYVREEFRPYLERFYPDALRNDAQPSAVASFSIGTRNCNSMMS